MAYGYYASITVDHTKVSGDGDLTNFPILVSGTYDGTGSEPDIRTVANGGHVQNTASGGNSGSVTVPADLVFSPNTDGSSPYDFEIESYDASTGAIVAWVEIPTLDGDADTVLYMVYGDSSVTTSQEDVNGTWDANYKMVVHYNGNCVDSTSSGYDLTPENNPTYVAGKVGPAGNLVSASSQAWTITDANSPNIDTQGAKTWQGWVYPNDADPTDYYQIISKDTNGNRGTTLYSTGTGKKLQWIAHYDATNYTEVQSATISGQQWYCCFGRDDNSALFNLTVNGTQTNAATYHQPRAVTNPVVVGRLDGWAGYYSDAKYDELRVSDTYRSDDWIATDYATQSDPSTFYAMGTETAIETGVNFEATVLTLTSSIPSVKEKIRDKRGVSFLPLMGKAVLGRAYIIKDSTDTGKQDIGFDNDMLEL